MKRALRPLYHAVLGLRDFLEIRSRHGLPPSRLMLPQYGSRKREAFDGAGAFLGRRIIELGTLASDGRILDIGCGTARVALGLAGHLSGGGRYDGMDVDEESIEWARRNLSSRHPHLHFHFMDVRNDQYRPQGAVSSAEYHFPFEDAVFDLAHLHSVFTHMRPPDMRNYLGEIARMLKPGGRLYATYYLLDENSLARIAQGGTTHDFRHDFGEFRSISAEVPEFGVAYPEATIRSMRPMVLSFASSIFPSVVQNRPMVKAIVPTLESWKL